MKLTKWYDEFSGKIFYKLEIDKEELVKANLYDFDRLLLEECELSGKLSDKILGLETLVRRIEEANA